MPKRIRIEVKLNIQKDALNWWSACNTVSLYGVDWKKKIRKKLWQKIYKKTQKEAMKFLLPYLRKYYKEHHGELNEALHDAKRLFNRRASQAIMLMEKITQHPLHRTDFICFLTTFPRCPYNYTKGYIWLAVPRPTKYYLGIFLHELLHFQYYAYYIKKSYVKKLSKTQSEFLKESLTVILNDEFKQYFILVWKN